MMWAQNELRSHHVNEKSRNGLLFLGNPGVGKSFLGNIVLRREAFEHKCSSSSVTDHAEFQDTTIGSTLYSVFNLSGLLNDNQTTTDRNKREIYKAFQQCPNSIVAFVFTGESGGRLRNEDLTVFKALDTVYGFQQQSLVLIINNLPQERPISYENELSAKLQDHCKVPNVKICLLDHINIANEQEREQIRSKLIATILQCTPHVHSQQGQIQLPNDKFDEARTADIQRKTDEKARLAEILAKKKEIEEKADKDRQAHQVRMAALRAQGKGADVTYQYYKRGQPGTIIKSEKTWIPVINGNLTISGPSNVPADLEVHTLVHSINF
jgi:hypothetical protein